MKAFITERIERLEKEVKDLSTLSFYSRALLEKIHEHAMEDQAVNSYEQVVNETAAFIRAFDTRIELVKSTATENEQLAMLTLDDYSLKIEELLDRTTACLDTIISIKNRPVS